MIDEGYSTKLNAMRLQALREKWPAITQTELDNLCRLAGVIWDRNATREYYQILNRRTNGVLLELSKQRSAPEFVEAFRGIGLL